MSTYDEQAANFLARNNLRFRATFANNQTCPPWSANGQCDHVHGDKYRVTISRKGESGRLTFDFWNSQADAQAGREPCAYDVLACISSDAYCPSTFEDFCGEFGCDEDSRTAEKTFKCLYKFADRLRTFFSEQEIEELSEIR